MSFKEFLEEFKLEELKKVREMDFSELAQKAKKIAEEVVLEDEKCFLSKTLKEKAVSSMAYNCFEPGGARSEGKVDFKKEIDKRIRDWDKIHACGQCKKNPAKITFDMFGYGNEHLSFKERGFCSKKCVLEYIEKEMK